MVNIMENPIKMDDLGENFLFSEPPICFLNLYILVFETACFSRPPEEDLGWLKMFQLPKVFGTSVDYETITY